MDNRTAVRSRGRICLASNACSLKKRKLRKGARFHVFESLRLNAWEAYLLFAIEAEERLVAPRIPKLTFYWNHSKLARYNSADMLAGKAFFLKPR